MKCFLMLLCFSVFLLGMDRQKEPKTLFDLCCTSIQSNLTPETIDQFVKKIPKQWLLQINGKKDSIDSTPFHHIFSSTLWPWIQMQRLKGLRGRTNCFNNIELMISPCDDIIINMFGGCCFKWQPQCFDSEEKSIILVSLMKTASAGLSLDYRQEQKRDFSHPEFDSVHIYDYDQKYLSTLSNSMEVIDTTIAFSSRYYVAAYRRDNKIVVWDVCMYWGKNCFLYHRFSRSCSCF